MTSSCSYAFKWIEDYMDNECPWVYMDGQVFSPACPPDLRLIILTPFLLLCFHVLL